MPNPVLIVDDNRSITDGLCKFFDLNGYPAEAVYSAQELKERYSKVNPAAVVLDICLGNIDGIQILPELKQAWPDTPVVMLTAKGYDNQLMEEARKGGAHGYVSKSVPPQEVLAKVIGIIKHPEHYR